MRRDLHDRGKQGERATPRSAQSHTVVHYLANDVLHTPTVVLHRLVEPLSKIRRVYRSITPTCCENSPLLTPSVRCSVSLCCFG